MLQTISTPEYWYGVGSAYALMAIGVLFIAALGRISEPLPPRDYRAGDRKPWPGRTTNSAGPQGPDSGRSRRSEMRGGPR